MRILLTGGLGYIGQNIIKHYSCINEFQISDYYENSGLKPIQEYTHLYGIKGVIHLAALSGIAACEENPEHAIRDNILSADHLFKLSVDAQIPVVFTSSQAAKTPTSSVYAFMKWTIENLAKMYNKQGARIYIVRLSNVYGGKKYLEKKNTVIKQFITQYNNNQLLEIHGSGSQIRDFIHVKDVCKALMNIIESTPGFKGPYDIGTGKGTSIMEVVNMFPIKLPLHYRSIKGRNSGTNSSIADIRDAKEILKFQAKEKLEDYIKEMING